MQSQTSFKFILLVILTLLVLYFLIGKENVKYFKNSVKPIEIKQMRKIKSLNLIKGKNWDFKVNKIYAMVFFGRKQQTQILLRYLERNVKENGGVLDKIVFAVKTNKKPDLDYLNSVMAQNKSYFEKIYFKPDRRYAEIYTRIPDNDLIFKIDDDIVFIANGTFERMIDEYMTNKLLFLSGNVVYHPLLSYVHARMRAIMPFDEVKNFTFKENTNGTELDETVANGHTYDAFSKWWKDARCAAIAHESLMHHIETDNLDAYDFNVWDFHSSGYTRWSINFVLMRGKYVNNMTGMVPNMNDDEVTISKEIPKLLKRHCYALGSAVVAHFSYGIQYEYLAKTNLLDRYDKISLKYLGING